MPAKFDNIKRHIVAQIESAIWVEGVKIPSENALATQFHCSRMTARRAITELVTVGILEASQGQGTFVAALKSMANMMSIRNIKTEIEHRGKTHTSLLVSLGSRPVDISASLALELPLGTEVFHSELLHFEGDIPLQLESRQVHPQRVPGYLQQDFTQITPHEYLSKVTPLTRVHHQIEAVLPSIQEQQQLKLLFAEPCLLVKRATYSSLGAISYAQLLHPGSRYRLGENLITNENNKEILYEQG